MDINNSINDQIKLVYFDTKTIRNKYMKEAKILLVISKTLQMSLILKTE